MFDVSKFHRNIARNYTPKVSDKWKIESVSDKSVNLIDEQNESCNVHSGNLLEFILLNKFKVENNILYGRFILDCNGFICEEKEYIEWLKTSSLNVENEIKKDDLKVGYVYQLENKNDYFLYLGHKYTIQWKYDKNLKSIVLTKVSKKYFGYEVYKNSKFNIDSLYSKRKIFLSNKKIIKEVCEYKGKYNIETILQNIKYSEDYVYLDDKKPDNNINLKLIEIDENYLRNIGKNYEVDHINIFHKSLNFYIKNHYFIYLKDEKNDDYSRQISKSDNNNVIFKEPKNNSLEKYEDKVKYYFYENKLNELGKRCENDNFVIAPKNYYLLSV